MRRRGGRLGSPNKVSSAKSNHGAPLALTNYTSLCSCLQMATFDPTGAKTMITAPQYDFRPLPYLVSLGVVGAATVGIFFGAGFLLLAPPLGVGSSADPVPPILALEAHEVPPPAINETASGSSMASAAEKTAASPMSGAPSNREASGFAATAIDTAFIPPTRSTHPKRVRVLRYQRQVPARHWAELWRPDARAGPNPGGGFYGPPNINVGYVDAR